MTSTAERRRDARGIWDAGVAAVRPETLLPKALRASSRGLKIRENRYARADLDRIVVVGAGKAAGAMTRALMRVLAPLREAGLTIEGSVNVAPGAGRAPAGIDFVAARQTADNLPTEAGVDGARRILELVRGAGSRDLVIGLISGGGSALLPLPAEGLTLADKIRATRDLAAAGAPIEDLNTVRKHLSAIKGGQLAQHFRGLAFETLVISDIVGDPLDAIASGPTVPDPTSFTEALAAAERHLPLRRLPLRVRRRLQQGAAGEVEDTPLRLAPQIQTQIIGRGAVALRAMGAEARLRGWRVLDLGAHFEGETSALARFHAGLIRAVIRDGSPRPAPLCLLSGGETTVALCEEPGRGGRNQEFALHLAQELAQTPSDFERVTLLAAGSDGEDGPTDAAGALLDAARWRRLLRSDMSPAEALRRNDVYPLLDEARALVKCGATGTNTMDLRVVLIA
jgi:glycerate 2-kinase